MRSFACSVIVAGLALFVLPVSAWAWVAKGTLTATGNASTTQVVATGNGSTFGQTYSTGVAVAGSIGGTVTLQTGKDPYGRALPAQSYAVKFYNSSAAAPGFSDHYHMVTDAGPGGPGVQIGTVSIGTDGKIVGGPKTFGLGGWLRPDGAPQESAIALVDSGGAFGLEAPVRIVDVAPPASAGGKEAFGFVSARLSDRVDVGVNVADGDLLVHNEDLHIAGTGEQDFDVDRYYDSNLAGLGRRGALGVGASSGLEASLAISASAVDFSGGDGATYRFALLGGAPVAPVGLDADLSITGGRFYDVVLRTSGARLSFDSLVAGGALARLVAIKDRYGNAVQITRNTDGTISRVTDPQGRQSTFTSDPTTRHLTDITDVTGRGWHYRYGTGAQADQLQSYIDPAGKTTSYGFDGSDRMTSISTPAGRVTKIGYDAQGRVTSLMRTTDVAHTSGPTTTFAYGSGASCGPGESTTVVSDPLATGSNGHTTTYCSDGRRQLTKTLDSNANTTTLAYAGSGKLTSVTSARGAISSYGFDAASNLVCVQRGASSAARADCGSQGAGLKTRFAYANTDALTRYFATSVTDPQGHIVAACYNGAAPACGTSSGPAGSLQSTTDQLIAQSVKRFAYNAKGNLSSVTDGAGHTTGYGYDAAGSNLALVTPPGGARLGNRTLTRDALSRPRVVTDGKGQTATTTYDLLDRPTSVAYAPGGPTVSYAYDDDGALTALTDTSGATSYDVDQLGRLTGEHFPGGLSNAYGYDAASNLKSVTDDGAITSYAYDTLNQLTAVTEPGDTQATTFAYNADGQRTQIKYPSGVSVNTSYDPQTGRATSVINKSPAGSVLKSFAYTYTLGGVDTELPQSITDEAANTTVITYDALDRVTDAVTSGGPNPSRFHYEMDGDGRRTFETSANARELSLGTLKKREIAYDSAGLPCRRFAWTYSSPAGSAGMGCTSAGTPVMTVTDDTHDANANDVNTLHQRYTYNSADQPTSVGVWTLGGAPQQLAYRGSGQSQLIQDGALTVQNNILGISARGQTYYARAGDGTLLTERTPSGRFNYLYDATGTVIALTNSSGTVTTSYTYDAYGHPLNLTSLGNENAFASKGAYTLGMGGGGVTCGGPVKSDPGVIVPPGPRDPEDGGRPTQPGTARPGLWPKTAEGMDGLLGIPGKRIPDGPSTPGRGKVEWWPNSKTRITYEQHPYHPAAPDWHRGPHWHLDTPGNPHQRFVAGSLIPYVAL